MGVPISEQVSAREAMPGGFVSIRSRLLSFYQAFPAPFSERRTLLVLGDAVLVILSIFAAYWI